MSATSTARENNHQLPHPILPPKGLVETAKSRPVGYGLPCSNCGTYYAGDQPACPICCCSERVSATAAPAPAILQNAEPMPEADQLEQERERFLKEFKSQLFSAHMQINAAHCSLEANHGEEFESAAICKSCHDRLQQRADQLEAALHIDLKEAAQIVYEAVWSDPSDPRKTYQNAAQALLTELHKRAGIPRLLIGPHPYKH